MMSNDELPLRDLTVEGYRGIRHLQLPTLERVNLFVGLNNAGKTSLLEAIRIHAEPQPIAVLWELLRQRNEYNAFRSAVLRGRQPINEEEVAEAARAVESLFTRDSNSRIVPRVEFASSGLTTGTTRLLLPWWKGDAAVVEPAFFASEEDALISVERDGTLTSLPLQGLFGIFRPGDEEVVSIGPEGFSGRRISSFWSRAAGLGQAPLVEETFRCFLPETKRIHVLSGAEAFYPVVAVEVEGTPRPIPLAEMGDGTRRVLGIVLAMVNAQGGILLIDEVENGLHHSVQDAVWAAIVTLAEQLHVQVFATTHSWDTVVAFQLATRKSEGDGMLYRLERRPDGEVDPVAFTEAEVAIAARHDVEIR
jgi:ABC-type branched-subunit amino acid transport system ATPase component